jgi:hypothetical protein
MAWCLKVVDTRRAGKGGVLLIFTREGVEEIINLQPKGSKAKPYQVRQVRSLLLKYKIGGRA